MSHKHKKPTQTLQHRLLFDTSLFFFFLSARMKWETTLFCKDYLRNLFLQGLKPKQYKFTRTTNIFKSKYLIKNMPGAKSMKDHEWVVFFLCNVCSCCLRKLLGFEFVSTEISKLLPAFILFYFSLHKKNINSISLVFMFILGDSLHTLPITNCIEPLTIDMHLYWSSMLYK